jgi:hypothetical protein
MTKHYTTKNGIRKVDPAWQPAVPFTNKATALAVVASPDDANNNDDDEIVVVATPIYEAAVAQYHDEVEPEIFIEGSSDHHGLEELNQVLAKYEVPGGMLSKLLGLQGFHRAEIIVDDSGSMQLATDAKGPNGEELTRWWEAKYRIAQMIELMAYVISPPITVRFLNRPDILEIQRQDDEVPSEYIARVETLLVQAFQKGPSGTTPAREAISASIHRYQGQSVLRYFLGDGVPNGGEQSCREIENLLLHRADPEKNPFTFMSCTSNDADTEWMKQCEEKAPYCSEFDDYGDESREILKDQGDAFPYSYGLHLVAQIVAAFNPHDMDAMDESVPFSRQTLDNLLGYQSSPQEYKYYYDLFVVAQHKLPLGTYQRDFVQKLPSLYEQFESAAVANDIPDVVQYKQKLKSMAQQQQAQQRQLGSSAAQPPPECCVIL